MRFLLDQNLPAQPTELLTEADHDAIHVRRIGMSRSADHEVLAAAAQQDRVLVSSDTDFGELLATSNAARPSMLLLRRQRGRRAVELAGLLLANLADIADDLTDGSIVVFDEVRIGVRRLPLRPDD